MPEIFTRAPDSKPDGRAVAPERLVQLTPLPVNIMVTRGVPEIPELARAGVRRVSLVPWPMMATMRVIGEAAAAVVASKQYGSFLQPNA
ncbi:2-methylisocitrate lyase-like PEP mutase family enzyme [Bradyrhizobium sp. USDA 4011]